jgi:hypothetical protein
VERITVRRASRAAIADVSGDERVVYDVVLLAGSPRRHTLKLAFDIAEGSEIDVDGEQWTVADVRVGDGVPTRLICIYAA